VPQVVGTVELVAVVEQIVAEVARLLVVQLPELSKVVPHLLVVARLVVQLLALRVELQAV
jgi:hypothetical protein